MQATVIHLLCQLSLPHFYLFQNLLSNTLHNFFQPDGFPAFGVGTHAESMVPNWHATNDLQPLFLLFSMICNTHGDIAKIVIFKKAGLLHLGLAPLPYIQTKHELYPEYAL